MADAISSANEEAILSCAKPFLIALGEESDAIRNAVTYYFGIFEVELVAEALLKLEQDPDVSALVREHFAQFTETR